VKCIRCSHDSKLKDRTKRHCPGCQKEFAFEPREGDLFTDVAFQAAIDAVSGQGKVRWGVEHLYYEVCRRRRRAPVPKLGVLGVAIAAFVVGIQTGRFLVGVVLAVAGVIAFVWLMRRRRVTTVAVSTVQFDRMWDRWQKVHGTPKGVIIRKGPRMPARAPEPDLADYSFDRAVICDRNRTVDLLLANNFHFENNCAVLSSGGYPPGPFETVRAMLRRNPKLQVFVLHDATPSGCRLAGQLATSPEWFRGLPSITDVGLRPKHAGPLKGLYLPSGAAVKPGDGIGPDEAAWLARYVLELAAIRPEQVLKRLFRAINRAKESDDDDDDDRDGSSTSATGSDGSARVDEDSDAFSADAADGDGGADAFG
jgi:hypothetical protein